MDADGANQTQLNTIAAAYQPAWSPDGTKIVFANTQTSYPNVFVMNADGSNPVQLTINENDAGNDDPAWSPDGTKIVFVRHVEPTSKLYVMNADGSNPIRLTNTEAREFDPAWSPDGGKIAFVSRVENPAHIEIYVIGADGSNPTSLTSTTTEATNPAWSPDGTKILFRKSNSIWVMNRDGSQQTRLTSSFYDRSPTWSPDGTKIAFCRGFYGEADIFLMDAYGTNRVNITNQLGSETPDWQRLALTPTPTPTPTTTPTPTPVPPARAQNLSTRMNVQTGANVAIGGFIITGSAPKHLLLRAIGPSLTQLGIANALADPVVELRAPGGFVTIANDNWKDDPVQQAAIIATGIPPSNDLESAIDVTLLPGAYTAIVNGKNNTTGVGLIEVYDLSQSVLAKLANISTRAFVGTGSDMMIAGFILGGNSGATRIIVRGLGPSLTSAGVPDALPDPMLQLRDTNGTLLMSNNDWQDNPAQANQLTAAGLAPASSLESGIAMTLSPGPYTALLGGQNNVIGVGLIEVYDLGSP
jgi:hypothetical protein